MFGMGINKDLSIRQLRWFAGLWWPLLCCALAGTCYARWHWTVAAAALLGAGAVLGVAGLARPRVAQTVYRIAMTALWPLNWVVSNLVVIVVYYLVITPISVVARLAGHDPLGLRAPESDKSYWRRRKVDADPESSFRQY
jgi:hypothetical protein